MLPCYVCILCLRHNIPYARWHQFWMPPFCKQSLRATLFSRKQTRSSRMLFSIFAGALYCGVIWKIKSKSNFPVSFNLISAEMNLIGNYRKLRGLRTVNPEWLSSTIIWTHNFSSRQHPACDNDEWSPYGEIFHERTHWAMSTGYAKRVNFYVVRFWG